MKEKKEIVISFVGKDAKGKPRIVNLKAPLVSETLRMTIEGHDGPITEPQDIIRAYFKDNKKTILVCNAPGLKSSTEFKDVSGLTILVGVQ